MTCLKPSLLDHISSRVTSESAYGFDAQSNIADYILLNLIGVTSKHEAS